MFLSKDAKTLDFNQYQKDEKIRSAIYADLESFIQKNK